MSETLDEMVQAGLTEVRNLCSKAILIHDYPKPIPVTERLPEPHVRVLLCIGNGVAWVVGDKSGHSSVKWKTDVIPGSYRELPGITHWLPLPPPTEPRG